MLEAIASRTMSWREPERAAALGIVIVVAAGNDGPGRIRSARQGLAFGDHGGASRNDRVFGVGTVGGACWPRRFPDRA
jgi:hypothetical protein